MMADPNFLRNLQEMNCDLITQQQVKAVKAHMKKSKKLDTMQQISKAGYVVIKHSSNQFKTDTYCLLNIIYVT